MRTNTIIEAQNQQPQGLSLSTPNNNQMSQQLVQSKLIPSNPSTHELIQFGEVSLSLPKKDLRKQWGKLQKYMDIYLEDYEEDSDIDRSTSIESPIEPTSSLEEN